MSDPISTLAPHFFQVGYVVSDLADAEEWFQRVMGVPSFMRSDNVVLKEDCLYRGRPADSAMNLSLGFVRGTQVELIEHVRGPSIYDEFLKEKGPGLHHLGFTVPDFPAAYEMMRKSGLEPISEGHLGSGTDFAYFDCEAAGASIIELLGFDEATTAIMEQLRKSSENAD